MNIESNPKILMYAFGLSGGAGDNLARIAGFLAENGFSIHLSYAKSDSCCIALSGDQVRHIPFDVSRSWKVVPKLAKELRLGRYDLVFVTGGINAIVLLCAMLVARKSVPYIIRESNSPSGLLQESRLLSRWIKKILTKIAYHSAEKIISICVTMEEELHLKWQVPKEKLTVIYNGVNIPDGQEIKRLESSQIANCNGERRVTILTVGRLTLQKDHATLLYAFARLNVSATCRLVIVGEGREKKRLRDLAVRLGVDKQVDFIGYVEDPHIFYRTADVFVLSSRFEGFPNVLIEALSYGLPVVSTDCLTGPREILADGLYGEIVPVGDSQAMCEAIARIIKTQPNRDMLVDRAKFFNREKQLLAYVQLVLSLLTKNSPLSCLQ